MTPLSPLTASQQSGSLTARDLHLWVVRLDRSDETVAELERSLMSDEIRRADRFVFERDRRRFVVCRAALRTVLGGYLGCEPEALRFSYGEHGKPALSAARGAEIEFNVAHAADVGVFAFACGTPVGVDVEALDRTVDFEGLASRFFSAGETRQLLSLPAADRRAGFFNCWTRKEAYIKAIGDGLSCPLDSFGVSLTPGAPARLQWVDHDPREAECWQMTAFYPAAGFVGAVAIRERDRDVSVRVWTDPGGRQPATDLGLS